MWNTLVLGVEKIYLSDCRCIEALEGIKYGRHETFQPAQATRIYVERNICASLFPVSISIGTFRGIELP